MHQKFTEFILCTLAVLSIPSQVASLSRVRKFTSAKRSKFEILDFIGLVEEQGRTAEWHNVTTDDGYILALFRIPPNPLLDNTSHSSPPVYLQHGLGASSEMFISFGPENNLAYTLSDAGYDVWLGNVRGGVYSDRHETLSPDQPQFWDFSMDEAALMDLPAMLDYILETTGKSKLSYVGYSMGTTLSVILLSNRTEYNDKMNLVVHFSHCTIWRYPNHITLSLAVSEAIVRSIVLDGAFGIMRNPEIVYALIKHFCRLHVVIHTMCIYSYAIALGRPYEGIDVSNEEFLLSILRSLSPLSTKTGLHLLQHIRTSKFRFYDHGDAETNLLHYGQIHPPHYNISNVATPLLIFHGTTDLLTPVNNIEAFTSKLPSSTTVIFQPVHNFNHVDFFIAKDVKQLVYDKLLVVMSKYCKPN